MSPKSSLFDGKFIMLIGGLLAALLVVIILSITLSFRGGGVAERSQLLYLQLSNLHASAGEYQNNLRSSSLRAVNSELSLQLTNSIRELSIALEGQGIDVSRINQGARPFVAQAEHNENLNERLLNARLNAALDRIYGVTMSYELELILSNINQITNATRSDELRETLDGIAANLQVLQERFSSIADQG